LSEQPTLFDLPKPLYAIEPAPIGPKDTRSYTRRLTIRKNAMLAGGKHPATKMPLRHLQPEHSSESFIQSCGTCAHSKRYSNGNRGWWKCELVPVTSGPGTDIRLRWPACVKWEPE
jgi:hypothetical protein